MDLKQLRTFLHVAETGSLTKAAERLNVTQPALSRHIQALEEAAGVPLFVRTGRGLILSEAGREIAPRIQILAEEMERLRTDMAALSGEVRGEVRLGLPPSVGLRLAGPVVETFHKRYPHVQLGVTQLLSGAIEDNLLNGRLDIGVIYEGDGLSSALRRHPLWGEDLYFITPAVPQWVGYEGIRFAECLAQPLVLPSARHGLRVLITAEAAKISASLDIALEVDSLSIHLEMVRRGLGCTILSYDACKSLIEAGHLYAIPITDTEIRRVWSLVWAKDYPLTRAAQAMADTLKEQAALMPVSMKGDQSSPE